MTREEIKKIVQGNDALKSKLFCRGFLITNDFKFDTNEYPFFGLWNEINAFGYRLITHPLTKVHIVQRRDFAVGMIGHALNPLKGTISERLILAELADVIRQRDAFFSLINQLTGVFSLFLITSKGISVLCDAAGLQTVFYSSCGEKCYLASHANIIGDLLDLSVDPFVTSLKKCHTFKFFGNQLPGNISQFKEVQRINPNHFVFFHGKFDQRRFYCPHCDELDVETIYEQVTKILCETMRLIPEKWKRPAISLTGGCDSRTTLACACGVYDKYTYFSYDSQKKESVDAIAALKLSKELDLPFTYYKIPTNDAEFAGIDNYRAVLLWNGGDIRYNNAPDVRKRVFFSSIDDFDVEVKSWVSEIGRARYTKRYNGRCFFGKEPTPRVCTTFYKFLLFNRRIVRATDAVFKSYLDNYFEQDRNKPIPWQDQFYWEWHWPSRDGLNLISEQQYAYEITVPYNNRIVLELLLSVPEQMRIGDDLYSMIRSRLDPRIDKGGALIVDTNHTKVRAVLEDLYYSVNNILPF